MSETKIPMCHADILEDIERATQLDPVKSYELEIQHQVTGAEVRATVRHYRREGIPIASSGDGYFVARTLDEARPTIRHMRSRAVDMLNTATSIEEAFL